MKRTLKKLPKRSDKYGALECSGRKLLVMRCPQPVEFIASYEWKDGLQADRLYCKGHAERFAARWGVKVPK